MSFADDIAAQGEALRDFVDYYRANSYQAERIASGILTRKPTSIILTGMGTSEHVGWLVADAISEAIQVPIAVRDAGELLHYGLKTIQPSDIVVGVSQSGESVETAKLLGALSGPATPRKLVVTNNPESSMGRCADALLPIIAGEESSISTRTYTNTLAALLMFAHLLASKPLEEFLSKIEAVASLVSDQANADVREAAAAAKRIAGTSALYFVSRGPAMTAALQSALTFQEGCHVPACALTGGAFRHGPMELSGSDLAVVIFAPIGHGGDLLRSLAKELAELGSVVVLLSSTAPEATEGLVHITVPASDPETFPIMCAVPQERLLNELAAVKGLTPGEFRVGGKVTLVE